FLNAEIADLEKRRGWRGLSLFLCESSANSAYRSFGILN
ncbi:MAG: hypothetical protein ACI93T_004610, partial [Porticoccaceae bacterium]